jgi:hypothetical protein
MPVTRYVGFTMPDGEYREFRVVFMNQAEAELFDATVIYGEYVAMKVPNPRGK